ncbi:hypothetical protein QAD02_020153 [Eretmocerus hayati]|uniref:Uncharacterized protein n=1 Tax=Eretmocerus hayati TaxID=131215 RepID=A0ACC2PMV4_9HYME|nr:hypothetical protein QAD02_020153 [Eretmocerus hayati]
MRDQTTARPAAISIVMRVGTQGTLEKRWGQGAATPPLSQNRYTYNESDKRVFACTEGAELGNRVANQEEPKVGQEREALCHWPSHSYSLDRGHWVIGFLAEPYSISGSWRGEGQT